MLAQRTVLQATRAARVTATRSIHSTPRLLQAAAREEHAAHTATQRLRYWIKSLPIETYPLCMFCLCFHGDHHSWLAIVMVMGFSLSFGVYSFIRPALQDPTLRLKRSIAHAAGVHHWELGWGQVSFVVPLRRCLLLFFTALVQYSPCLYSSGIAHTANGGTSLRPRREYASLSCFVSERELVIC